MSCAVDRPTAVRMLLFVTARDMLSAATRLSLIGPMQAAQVLVGLTAYIETLLASATSTSIKSRSSSEGSSSSSSVSIACEQDFSNTTSAEHSSDYSSCSVQSSSSDNSCGSPVVVWQVDPIQEILQGSHEKLYSRLFNS
jgi:urease accessory protein UreF